MASEKHILDKTSSRELHSEARLNVGEHPNEVTGLGIIASLIVASWFLVSDGTLRLSSFLVVTALLLVGAGGLTFRLFRENSGSETVNQKPDATQSRSGLIK
jgi:hypothetical protein